MTHDCTKLIGQAANIGQAPIGCPGALECPIGELLAYYFCAPVCARGFASRKHTSLSWNPGGIPLDVSHARGMDWLRLMYVETCMLVKLVGHSAMEQSSRFRINDLKFPALAGCLASWEAKWEMSVPPSKLNMSPSD